MNFHPIFLGGFHRRDDEVRRRVDPPRRRDEGRKRVSRSRSPSGLSGRKLDRDRERAERERDRDRDRERDRLRERDRDRDRDRVRERDRRPRSISPWRQDGRGHRHRPSHRGR